MPVHAKFNRLDAPHHWTISSRTLRQLMEHFGPGTEFLDINADGGHVNFTCFSEKTVSEEGGFGHHLRWPSQLLTKTSYLEEAA